MLAERIGELDFLLGPTPAAALELPTAMSAEAQMMAAAVRAFMDHEVLPRSQALDRGDVETLRELFRAAAALGITGLLLPERYGGPGLSQSQVMRVVAEVAREASFSNSFGAHFGIGTLPLALFGREELKARYLPALASASLLGAYALTEPGAGSDALGVRTRAVRDGGDFVLDGSKQFITNAGIAGLYTVFAKVEGAFTAFLVPAETPGVVASAPERKLGLRGSPTASLSLEGVRIPADHALGEIGAGHRVAFNILNVGRMKLGVSSLGHAREALRHAATYAAERHQFGRPIAAFPLVRDKLASAAARIFLLEGVCLRIVASMDRALGAGLAEVERDHAVEVLKAHAPLSAMVKVLGSETVAQVVDEAVQIHGGYGFIEDYPVCRMYRDVRVNRIFEGTNEINRLLIAGDVLGRGRAGRYALADLLAVGRRPAPGGAPGAAALCADLRWALGRIVAAAMEALGPALREHQLVLADLADLVIELYALDTAVARVEAGMEEAGRSRELLRSLLDVATEDSRRRVLGPLTRAAAALLEPGQAGSLVAALAAGAVSTDEAGDEVASAVLEPAGLS